MAERVNITTAAKLTGRAEKTIRAWLAEDPCPLSIEYGQYRGGRKQGKGRGAPVTKGRTRLLDVGELQALHVKRGGVDWHAQYLPGEDMRAVLERLAAVEATLEALRQRAPYLFGSVARSEPNLGEWIPEDIQAPRRHASASTVRRLAPGAFPSSANGRGRWIEAHGGPGTAWARSWPDVLEWQGPEDAIAAVRQHKNWHDWQPRECADPSCECHALLGAGVPVGIEVSEE